MTGVFRQTSAQALGGSLTIESGISRGTSVTLKVPIRLGSGWRRWVAT
jgi:chemotaxis protein histidine kinase CheA